MRLREWAQGVWIAEAPLRFYGLEFGTRMTLVRLVNGALFVHSPIPLDAELASEIDALGPVAEVVSPNKLHHLYLGEARATWPDARVHAAPGLQRKRPELTFDAELGDAPDAAWAGTLDQLAVRGSRVMEEIAFFHQASRTLIVADLCEHFGAHSPWATRLVARIGRMYERPRMPPDWQLTFRDRSLTRASFERQLAWDFERVILAHGALIERDAKALFQREYAWALRG
jgi:hypothetical protein